MEPEREGFGAATASSLTYSVQHVLGGFVVFPKVVLTTIGATGRAGKALPRHPHEFHAWPRLRGQHESAPGRDALPSVGDGLVCAWGRGCDLKGW
jgi:hypothetical protein